MNLDLRSQNAQRTHVAIRTAAIDLALERGYAAMTIDDVARRAGVSRRTVFNYFPTKADLVVGGIPSPSERAVKRFVAGGGSLLHDLRDLLADALGNGPEAERYAAKMPVLLRDNPELNPVLHERVRIFADRIRCFAAQRLRLEESDPRVRALVDVAGMINRSALDLWSRAEEKGCTGCDRAAAIAAVTDSLERLFAFDAALRPAGPQSSPSGACQTDARAEDPPAGACDVVVSQGEGPPGCVCGAALASRDRGEGPPDEASSAHVEPTAGAPHVLVSTSASANPHAPAPAATDDFTHNQENHV